MVEFEEIYRTHFLGVYRYVYSLCRDENLAEEITQETFYKALTHMDQYRGECGLFSWLCQIAKNTYLSYVRKQKRFQPETVADYSVLTEQSMEAGFLDRDTAWQIHKRLHALPEPYKEVFSLRVLGELSFAQIGQLFGKTDSWARLVFYRAKKELRRSLDESTL
jgi:RNA polymerase sigma-70 factor (ECF subfamily)